MYEDLQIQVSPERSENLPSAQMQLTANLFEGGYQNLSQNKQRASGIDQFVTNLELTDDSMAEGSDIPGRLSAERRKLVEVKNSNGTVIVSNETYFADGKKVWQSVEDNSKYPPKNYTVIFDENENERARRTYSGDMGSSTTEFKLNNGERVRVITPGFVTAGTVERFDQASGKWEHVEDAGKRKEIYAKNDELDPQLSYKPRLPGEGKKASG
jgi:hypothetical protein